jgi:hypothetical protein
MIHSNVSSFFLDKVLKVFQIILTQLIHAVSETLFEFLGFPSTNGRVVRVIVELKSKLHEKIKYATTRDHTDSKSSINAVRRASRGSSGSQAAAFSCSFPSPDWTWYWGGA